MDVSLKAALTCLLAYFGQVDSVTHLQPLFKMITIKPPGLGRVGLQKELPNGNVDSWITSRPFTRFIYRETAAPFDLLKIRNCAKKCL